MEFHEVGHRIYTIGRAKQIGLLQYQLKDQDGNVIKQGHYSECKNALTELQMTARRKAWMGGRVPA